MQGFRNNLLYNYFLNSFFKFADNEKVKKSLRLLTFIIFSFALPVFGATYYWAGAGDGSTWTDPTNWRTDSETGTATTTHYPGENTGDTAYIAGNYTVTIDADISLDELHIQKSSETQYVSTSWTTTLTGTHTLAFDQMDFDRASSASGVTGTLVFDCPTTCNGLLETHSDTTFTANEPITLGANSDIKGHGTGVMTISKLSGAKTATLFCGSTNGITVSSFDTTDVPSIAVSSSSEAVSLGGGKIAALTVPTNRQANITGNLQVTGATSNSGTISAGNKNLTFDGAVTGASGTISGASISVSADTASNLGTVEMTVPTSITNNGDGKVTVTELSGNKTATLTNGASAGGIAISGYDESAIPSVTVASDNVSLGTGTIAALTVDTSVTATVAGGLTVTGATSNSGTISVGANSITFAGAVDSASGTVAMTTGGVTVSGAAASDFGTVQCAGGAFTNSGSGSPTVADFAMSDNSVVTNSAGGTLTLTKLSGAYNATIKSVSADNGITVNTYDATTKIEVAASSKNVSLNGGALDTLTINSGAKATVNGNITTTNGITNYGTLATSAAVAITGPVTNNGTIDAGANSLTFNDKVTSGASAKITSPSVTVNAAAASNLGTVEMTAATSITNNGDGKVTVTKLSGAEIATLTNGATAGGIAISGYDESAIPSVKVASDNVSLDGGTIVALTVNASVTATVSGNLTVTGATTNNGTIAAGANTVTFNGAVTSGASAGITTTTGKIITKTASGLGTVTVQSAGGSVEHAGSGAVTVTELVMDANASVTNSSTGSITVGTLTGAYTANLDNSSSGSITVSDYGAGSNAPKIVLAASSQNVSLAGGTIAALTLGSSAQANITGDLTVSGATTNNGTINAGTNSLTFNGAVTGASGTIKSTSITVGATTASNLGTVEMTAATSITNSGAGSTTVTKLTGNKTATLNASSGSITVSGYDAAPTIIASSQNISLGAGTIATLTVDGASDKATITGNLTVTGNITNNGTLDASAATITMTGAAPTLTGNATAANTKIKDLVVNSAAGADVKLTINSAHTITGTLDLKGTNGHPLIIEGSGGSITLPSTQDGGEFLKVARTGVSIDSTHYYIAENSEFDSDPLYGMDNNWVIMNPLMEFVWTGTIGATGTDWATASNWNYNLVPGLASATGGVDTRGYPVTIPDSPSSGKFPVAAEAYTVKSLQVGQAASSSATLELSSASNIAATAASAALSNYGTITYSSAGRVTDGTGTFINDAANGGTVEFAGASGATDLSTPTAGYYNLTINGSGTYTATGALTVTNALTASNGSVNFNASSDATETKAGSADFTPASSATLKLSLGNNEGDKFTLTGASNSLVLPAGLNSLTLAGTITVTAPSGITLAHDATLAANTTFASATTIDDPVKLTGAFTVENTAALTTTLTKTLTLVNASLKNTDAAANGYIIFEGTADQTFTPNAAAYSNITVNKTSGAFTVAQALETANLTITQSGGSTFNDLVTVSSEYIDAAAAGDITFNAGCDFTFTAPKKAEFATTGKLTLNSATNDCSFKSELIHTAGDTELSGNLKTNSCAATFGATTIAATTTIATTGGAATFGATTLNANLDINTGAGAATFGTLNGAFAFESSGSGALTLAGAVGATAAPTTITVTGPAIVTAPSIRTSGTQDYKGDLTFDANCTVTGSVKMTGDSATLGGTGKATIADFAYASTGASPTLTIENDNSFAKFSCTKGGATLTINGAQTITGTGTGAAATPLELKGADGNLLTINGSGSITLSAAQSATQYGQYLNVAYNGVSINAPQYYIAENSKFDVSTITPAPEPYGERNNWIILNPSMVFVWTGANGTDWGNRSNWNYNLIPGTGHGLTGDATSVPVNTKNYDVEIPHTPSGVSTNFPVVSAELGYSVGNLTIDENTTPRKASVTINTVGNTEPTDTGAIKIKAGKKLTNYGTIIYKNTGRVTQGNVFINDTAHNGTVVFDGTVAATDISAVQYYNLISSGTGNRTALTALTVLNDLTISGTGTFTSNAALTVTNALTVSNGSVNFNASSDATETKAGSADFTPASSATLKLSLGNNEGDKFTLTGASNSLVLPAGLNSLTLAGTITAPGGITLGHDATLADNTIFASDTTIDAPVNLTGEFTVENTDTLTTSSTNTLTLENASLVNTGAAANGYIIFEGTAPQTFTPNTAAYSNITVNKTSGAFTVAQALETANLTITQSGGSTFNELVKVTTAYSDAATAGNITFKAGCSFTPATTFNTTGTLTLVGTPTACAFTSGLTHMAGPTVLSGDLTTTNAAITLGKTSPDTTTTLAADTTINAGSGAVSINGTLNGAHDLTSNGTGLVTFGGTVGTTPTTEPTKITTAGSATFNAATNVNGPVAIAVDGEFNGTTTVADDISIDGNAAINGATTTTGSGKITIGGTAAINANTTSAATITVTGETTVTAASITSAGLQHYKDNIAFNSDCKVSGEVQAAANVATSGAAEATFNNDLWLYTNAGNAKDSTLGGGSASPSLDIKGNLYIVKNGKAATVASAVSCAKNILLLHGTLNVNAALSSTQDIILIGASYGINDAASGVSNLFAYNHASRKCPASYQDAFPPTARPDGTDISQPWSGAVATTAGATISAGQNFYANGLSSLGSGAWSLLLKDNNKQTDAFAEIYNSTITNCSANYKVAAAENVTANGCTNITTTRPEINVAYTVYDDVVYISFKDSAGNPVTIENSGNEISAAAANIRNSAGAYAALATYKDADCKTSTNGQGDIDGGFYIKSSNKWNTDANGTNAGADKSTDRGSTGALPTHRTTKPYLNLPKALSTLYETLRDSSKNRIAHYGDGHIYTAVTDQCAPVLIKVLTGQEMHEDPASQKDYDAHNFVEFVYSEPVDISSVSGATSVAESAVNVQAAADLGNATGTAGITFAGLAATSSGKIEAALKSGSGSPHSLYRNFSTTAGAAATNQAARIRVSIAGWVDGTVAGSYKNWAGYISSAIAPSGNITRIANANIKDKSPAQNSLDANPKTPEDLHALPTLTVQTSDGAANELYGTWDVTPPSFAPVRINGTTTWAAPAYDGSQEFEYVGASYGTGTLSAIEVHWFDNQPAYSSENRQWFSRVGWADASSPTQYSTIVSYAADVRGGSRPDLTSAPYTPTPNATVGGIRYCSLYNAYNAFKYSVIGSGTYHDFTQTIQGGAESSLFTYAGTATGTHTTGAEDGLYCKLRLDDTTLQPNTTFLMQFDSDACCVTDLAGNRIQCGSITMKSVDRTPPEYLMTAVPLGTKQMLIIFSKELNVDTLTLYDDATTHTDVSALAYIPQALQLTGGSGTIAIDQSVPATCVFRNNKSTGIVVTLSQNAVLNDITGGIFVNAIGVNKYDPLAGIPATITYIQDSIGNYLVPAKKHALSDFAVNAVNPQYAYDNTLTDGGVSTDYSLYQEGSWAVRDWNAEQGNYGTLSAAKEYIMQTTVYDGTSDNTGGAADFLGTAPAQTITSFFDAAPDFGSVSTKINENTKLSWRIWHPSSTPDDVFTSLAPVNNVYQYDLAGSANDSGVVFDIPQSVSSAKWKSGDQVSFLFKMGNYTVDHYDDGRNFPLYAVRLKDPNDITSLDLWSFKIKTTSLQRGGVSILNNVIDLNTGEHTVIQVDMKQSGNLNVIVMTLDGNIVTYLRHGQTNAGTHYYNWNGTNNGGSKVARGLYFVRVIGPGIDETRKVMCVK